MQRYRNELREGMTVYSADDHKVGKIVRCDPEAFIIEKGLFFPKDYFVRYEDVGAVTGDEVRLLATKDSLTRAQDSAETGRTREEARVPLAEEQLTAEKRNVEAGSVEVRKEVKHEQRNIVVPVTREEVHVERRPVHEPVRPADVAFKDETVRVPVREEEVEVRKRPVVREEVRVTKEPRVEHRTASETVRREEADVDRSGAAKPLGRDDDPLKKT